MKTGDMFKMYINLLKKNDGESVEIMIAEHATCC